MHSIHHPRRRCRVKSVSFHVLAWLLPRVAVERITIMDYPGWQLHATRNWLSRATTTSVQRAGMAILRQHPERRFQP